MTHEEAKGLVIWLTVSWPVTMKSLTTDQMKAAKAEELLQSFGKYEYGLVFAAFDKWKREHEKYPSVHNILNEIAWLQKERAAKRQQEGKDDTGWPMEIVYANGDEACYGVFTREQFVNHLKNPDHLQPEEWKRRFRMRRARIDAELGRISQSRYQAFMAKMDEIRAREARV